MTSDNIKSGFSACGIFPFNPDKIPNEAYVTNYIHSISALVLNPDLLEPEENSANDSFATNPSELIIENQAIIDNEGINKSPVFRYPSFYDHSYFIDAAQINDYVLSMETVTKQEQPVESFPVIPVSVVTNDSAEDEKNK